VVCPLLFLFFLGGLLTGDISGAAGAGAVAGVAPLLNELQSKVAETLQGAGLGKESANTISQALAELTSLGVGSAIGGTAGAGTALVVDTNNRQLHQTEYDRAKKYRDQAAKWLSEKEGRTVTPEEAEARILRQMERGVDYATAKQDGFRVDEAIVSFMGAQLPKQDQYYYDTTYNSQYIKANINAYNAAITQSTTGLTPQQVIDRNNAAGTPLAKAGLLGLGILSGAEVSAVLVRAAPEIAAKIGVSVEACLANLPYCASQAGIFASEVAAGDALGGAGLTLGAGAMGKAITQAGADARLSAKAAGLNDDAIRAAENLATTKALLQLETTSGGHFVSRHGEQLTDQQLIDRATKGILPDMPAGTYTPRPSDATRWASNTDMAEAITQAEKLYLADPAKYNKLQGKVTFDMGRIVGDGYTSGTAQHMGASTVTVVFKPSTGKPSTAYPVIDPKIKPVR